MQPKSVVIAGGGPTGLMLAAELALAGIDAAIIERRPTQELLGVRAGGLHPRTLEVLDQRGVAERFLAAGKTHPGLSFHEVPLNIHDLPSRHNYLLILRQSLIERILADWVTELSVPIYRSCEVTGFTQHDSGVHIELSNGQSMHAEYLVGCDGGRSLVRKTAGIEFPGWDATTSWLIAEAETAEEPAYGLRKDTTGIHGIGKLEDGKQVRVVLTEKQLNTAANPTLREVSEALIAVYGTDFGIHSPTWLSRFTDMTRQAATYRKGRILLAGDAAHVHPPIGGQGLNIGVQDAVNLGWKLAQVIRKTSPESLLDTYHAERHPVAARVLRNTMAHVALRRTDERSKALGEYVAQFLSSDEPRHRLAAEVSGLDLHYHSAEASPNPGEAHPLLGRRMPDLDLVTANGTLRTFTLLNDARPVLLNFGDPGSIDIAPWKDRVKQVDAKYTGTWELPALGTVPAPTAILIRPDGYVAWTEAQAQQNLTDALTTWFGPPTKNVAGPQIR